jgi:hypothetical protein
VRAAKAELETLLTAPMNRAFPNRTRVSHHVRGLAADAKRRLFAALGLGADSLYAPDSNPWAVRLLVADDDAPRDHDAGRRVFVRDQPEGPMREGPGGAVKDKGWIEPSCYSADGDNARALIAIIREARARRIKVVILLLPEGSRLRAEVPPEAMDCLHEALRKGFGTDAPPVFDFRNLLADSSFHDTIHPDRAGRQATTRALAEALRK